MILKTQLMNYDDDDDLLCQYLRKADRYEVIKPISTGSFGSVYLVKDKETGKLFAKKEIPFPPNDDLAPLYFFREFLSLHDFQIEGLPFLQLEGFNFPENENEAFIITEYVQGGSLSSLIRHRFSNCPDIPTAKMIIIYGIAFAIKKLHSRNIVHRDLKPENVLINEQKEPILADFGFARQIDEHNIMMTSKIGTLLYMAPELLENSEIESNCSIDVYAFAVLLLQIIYGKLSFNNGLDPRARTNEKIFKRHIIDGGRFDMPGTDKVPENFQKLITECWSQSPPKRWTMKKIVKDLQDGHLVLPGCNMDNYNQYIDKLNTIYLKSKSRKSTESTDEVEYTKEFNF